MHYFIVTIMNICFVPSEPHGLTNAAELAGLVAHLEKREVNVVPFASDMDATGLVAELTDPSSKAYGPAIYTARWLGKPVLALTHATFPPTFEDDVKDIPVRPVRYSQLYIAKVAIDVFLEAHCGYRVPLEAGSDRMLRKPTEDRLF